MLPVVTSFSSSEKLYLGFQARKSFIYFVTNFSSTELLRKALFILLLVFQAQKSYCYLVYRFLRTYLKSFYLFALFSLSEKFCSFSVCGLSSHITFVLLFISFLGKQKRCFDLKTMLLLFSWDFDKRLMNF